MSATPAPTAAGRARLTRLYEAHADAVYRYARHRVDVQTAEDVVAETFLIAWRRLDSVPRKAVPWLLATARKVIANEVRSESRRVALAARVATRSVADHPGEPDTTEDRHDVLAALKELPPADQEVLVTSAWYDLTAFRAAEVLGCSPVAYAVRLHRARKRLARLLTQSRVAAAGASRTGAKR